MDYWNSGESDAPDPPPRPVEKTRPGAPFKVILEPIGDFSQFETAIPLEDHYPEDYLEGPPPSAGIPDPGRQVFGFHASEFTRNIRKFGEPELVNVKFDAQFRGERADTREDAEGNAIVDWNRKDNPVLAKFLAHEESDSEADELLLDYLNVLKEKKKAGWVTDETLEYDESHDTIRNIHASSISLTSYGETPTNHRDFGNAGVLHRTMTSRERIMIGAPPPPPRPPQPENLKPYQIWSDHTMQQIACADREEAENYLKLAARPRPPGKYVDTWDQEYRPPSADEERYEHKAPQKQKHHVATKKGKQATEPKVRQKLQAGPRKGKTMGACSKKSRERVKTAKAKKGKKKERLDDRNKNQESVIDEILEHKEQHVEEADEVNEAITKTFTDKFRKKIKDIQARYGGKQKKDSLEKPKENIHYHIDPLDSPESKALYLETLKLSTELFFDTPSSKAEAGDQKTKPDIDVKAEKSKRDKDLNVEKLMRDIEVFAETPKRDMDVDAEAPKRDKYVHAETPKRDKDIPVEKSIRDKGLTIENLTQRTHFDKEDSNEAKKKERRVDKPKRSKDLNAEKHNKGLRAKEPRRKKAVEPPNWFKKFMGEIPLLEIPKPPKRHLYDQMLDDFEAFSKERELNAAAGKSNPAKNLGVGISKPATPVSVKEYFAQNPTPSTSANAEKSSKGDGDKVKAHKEKKYKQVDMSSLSELGKKR